jgi:hypothetical protein
MSNIFLYTLNFFTVFSKMLKFGNINSMMESSFESVMQMSIGQAVLRLADKTLCIIEKSMQWSLPTQEATAGKFKFI